MDMKFIVLIPFLFTEQRINPKFLCQQKAKSGRSGQDLFLWIINEQLPKPYNLAESNCQHFCFDVTQQFVDGDNPLPGRLALTVKNLIENKYRGGTSDATTSSSLIVPSFSLSEAVTFPAQK